MYKKEQPMLRFLPALSRLMLVLLLLVIAGVALASGVSIAYKGQCPPGEERWLDLPVETSHVVSSMRVESAASYQAIPIQNGNSVSIRFRNPSDEAAPVVVTLKLAEREEQALPRGDVRMVRFDPQPPVAGISSATDEFLLAFPNADGVRIQLDGAWDPTYAPLDVEPNTTALANQVIYDRLLELDEIVRKQQEELAALRTQVAAVVSEEPITPPAPTTTPKPAIQIFGQTKLDTIHMTGKMNNSESQMWALSRDDAKVRGTNDAETTMHARYSRIGLLAEGSAPGFDKLEGRIEFDFNSGDTNAQSRALVRIVHAFAKATKGPWTLGAGQMTDVISPLLPSHGDGANDWNIGNLGDRRPMFQVGYDPAGDGLDWKLAIGQTGAVDNQDLDKNTRLDGVDGGVPGLQARIGYKTRNLSVGLWGLNAHQETNGRIAGRRTQFGSYALGADLEWKLNPKTALRGEIWQGSNLSDVRGGIGQGINTDKAVEIRAVGGWGEIVHEFSPRYRIAVGYALDNPVDQDVPLLGRGWNSDFYIGNRWTLSKNLEVGLSWHAHKTLYKGLGDGELQRFNLYIKQSF